MKNRLDITYLDVEGWRRHKHETGEDLRVLIDGEDVTPRCFRVVRHAFNREQGEVWLFAHRDGRPYLNVATNRVATESRTGRVVITADMAVTH